MSRIVNTVRRHAVVSAVGAAVVLAGAGVGTAAVVASSPAADETAVETPASSSAPGPSTAAPTVADPADDVAPAEDTPAATVQDVTAPEAPAPTAQQTQAPTPTGVDLSTTWTDDAGNTYLPAPEVPVEKLDGEIADQDPAND